MGGICDQCGLKCMIILSLRHGDDDELKVLWAGWIYYWRPVNLTRPTLVRHQKVKFPCMDGSPCFPRISTLGSWAPGSLLPIPPSPRRNLPPSSDVKLTEERIDDQPSKRSLCQRQRAPRPSSQFLLDLSAFSRLPPSNENFPKHCDCAHLRRQTLPGEVTRPGETPNGDGSRARSIVGECRRVNHVDPDQQQWQHPHHRGHFLNARPGYLDNSGVLLHPLGHRFKPSLGGFAMRVEKNDEGASRCTSSS